MKNKTSFINSPFFCSEFQSVIRIVKIVHSVFDKYFEKNSVLRQSVWLQKIALPSELEHGVLLLPLVIFYLSLTKKYSDFAENLLCHQKTTRCYTKYHFWKFPPNLYAFGYYIPESFTFIISSLIWGLLENYQRKWSFGSGILCLWSSISSHRARRQ